MKNAARNAEIVRRRKAGDPPTKIAWQMRLSRNVVLGVLHRAGECDPLSSKSIAGSRHRGTNTVPVTEDLVRTIRTELSGLSYPDIAQRLNLTCHNVGRIARRDTWGHVA